MPRLFDRADAEYVRASDEHGISGSRKAIDLSPSATSCAPFPAIAIRPSISTTGTSAIAARGSSRSGPSPAAPATKSRISNSEPARQHSAERSMAKSLSGHDDGVILIARRSVSQHRHRPRVKSCRISPTTRWARWEQKHDDRGDREAVARCRARGLPRNCLRRDGAGQLHGIQRDLRNSIISDELPLTSDTVYSEIERDLVRPIYISSTMANDTFLRDWVLGGGTDAGK